MVSWKRKEWDTWATRNWSISSCCGRIRAAKSSDKRSGETELTNSQGRPCRWCRWSSNDNWRPVGTTVDWWGRGLWGSWERSMYWSGCGWGCCCRLNELAITFPDEAMLWPPLPTTTEASLLLLRVFMAAVHSSPHKESLDLEQAKSITIFAGKFLERP